MSLDGTFVFHWNSSLCANLYIYIDEPTNHLDSKTVQWLEEYLMSLKETTVLIVSHDTQFLEHVCSDGEY